MGPWSRGERTGVMVVLIAVTCVIGFGVLRAGQSAASSSGLSLREAFPQAPAAPPPVRPPAETHAAAPSSSSSGAEQEQAVPPADGANPPALPPDEIVVHVAGAVHHPGVYHLHPGARNDDALKAAGGPTAEANTDAVNLAARVEDGTQLYIPTHKERPDGAATADSAPSSPASSTSKGSIVPASASPKGKAKGRAASSSSGSKKNTGGNGKSDKLTSPSEGQINLNSASETELQRLPGVGPAMAARLIAFRQQNGGFHKVEDLLQVSGIGQKKYAKLQSFVKLH